MYLDDIIDHAKEYFGGNESRTATLKIKSVDPISLRIDHAMANFSAYAVFAISLRKGSLSFNRAYLVMEYPNGAVEVKEMIGAHHEQKMRAEADAIFEAFLAAA